MIYTTCKECGEEYIPYDENDETRGVCASCRMVTWAIGNERRHDEAKDKDR